MIEGVFDRVGTDGKVGLAVCSDRLSVGPEIDVVSSGKLKETEFPCNEASEIELIAKEEIICGLPLGSSVALSDRPVTDTEFSEDKVCKSNEVPLKSILEKLVVNRLAKSLVGNPPVVIEAVVVRPGAVRLTEIEGTEKLPVKILEDSEGTFGDRLDDSASKGSERLPAGTVGSTEPMLDELSEESPGRLGRSDVGTATEVGSGMRSDALKVPVVYTVTVYGVYDVIVTEPSQTGRYRSVSRDAFQQSKGRTRRGTPNRPLSINTNPRKNKTQGPKADLGWKGQRLHGDGQDESPRERRECAERVSLATHRPL